MKIADSVLDLVGQTPMVRLNRIAREIEAEILVKLEYLNPSGSIKDRIALKMIRQAEEEGLLHEGSRIVEASTGNTATSLAFVAAVLGYDLTVYMPTASASEERVRLVESYGASVVTVDVDNPAEREKMKDQGIHGSVVELIPREICLQQEREVPDTWWARQFSNQCNYLAHQQTTAAEILDQTDGRLDAFITSIGTAGTLLGVGLALREQAPSAQIVAVEPAASRTIEGGRLKIPIIEDISGGLMLELTERGVIDQVIPVSEPDAIDMAHRLAQEEGLFCGISSGANVAASLQVAREMGPGSRIVTLLVDSRDRYLFRERYTT
jgi:cysteine synthase A